MEGVDYEVEGVDSGEEEYQGSDSEEDGDIDMINGHDDFDEEDLGLNDDMERDDEPAEDRPRETVTGEAFKVGEPKVEVTVSPAAFTTLRTCSPGFWNISSDKMLVTNCSIRDSRPFCWR